MFAIMIKIIISVRQIWQILMLDVTRLVICGPRQRCSIRPDWHISTSMLLHLVFRIRGLLPFKATSILVVGPSSLTHVFKVHFDLHAVVMGIIFVYSLALSDPSMSTNMTLHNATNSTSNT